MCCRRIKLYTFQKHGHIPTNIIALPFLKINSKRLAFSSFLVYNPIEMCSAAVRSAKTGKAVENMAGKMEELGFVKLTQEQLTELEINPFKAIGKDWMLVSAGDEKKWNTMTASWGYMGVMWGANSAVVALRPQRYTKEFVDSNEYFSISFFDETYRQALAFCGANSGRDVDKAKETGLKPVFTDGSVGFEQARLVMVCKKQFAQEMKLECLTDERCKENWYPGGDYHTQYIGEIIAVYVKKQ